jgi:hypothetical protein
LGSALGTHTVAPSSMTAWAGGARRQAVGCVCARARGCASRAACVQTERGSRGGCRRRPGRAQHGLEAGAAEAGCRCSLAGKGCVVSATPRHAWLKSPGRPGSSSASASWAHSLVRGPAAGGKEGGGVCGGGGACGCGWRLGGHVGVVAPTTAMEAGGCAGREGEGGLSRQDGNDAARSQDGRAAARAGGAACAA